MVTSTRKYLITLTWGAGICLALALYLQGIQTLWQENPMLRENAGISYDQVFYMSSAEALARGDVHLMPRSRMPLYPWIMHFFFDPAKPKNEMLEVYMRMNVTISVLCLAAVALILRRPLGTWLACLITLIAAYRVFVFKAVLVQPELFYYTLYLALFLLMLRSLKRPTWPLLLATGLLAGITHLTKGSALPMIGIFTGLTFIKGVGDWWSTRRTTRKSGALVLLRPALFLVAFFSVTGVYLYNSYREYGNPAYDPNTRYYFWAESSQEMGAMQKTGLAYGKPKLSPAMAHDELLGTFMKKWVPDDALREEILERARKGETVNLEGKYDILPSFKHWAAAHSFNEAMERIWGGLISGDGEQVPAQPKSTPASGLLHPGKFSVIGRNSEHSNGYWSFLALFFFGAVITLVLAIIFARKKVWRTALDQWIPLAFIIASLLVPLITYGWWAQVSNRNRFFLTLYLPLLFVLGSLGKFACAHIPARLKLHWRERSIFVDASAVCLIVLTIFCVLDFRDPLNRKKMSRHQNLAELIAQ